LDRYAVTQRVYHVLQINFSEFVIARAAPKLSKNFLMSVENWFCRTQAYLNQQLKVATMKERLKTT